jgi:DNA-binding ferritin-like protein
MATKAAKSLIKGGAKAAGRKAARKGAVRAGAKVALKAGAKGTAKYIVGPAGVVLMTAEGLPVAAQELTDIGGRSRERYRHAKEAYRRGEYVEAAKRGAKGVLHTDLDIARGIGRTALAAFTAKELADMTRREKKEIRRAVERAKRNGNLAWAEGLLAAMLALRTAYQYAHWNARNYADHLLFERLYKSLDADIDTLAELTVRSTGRVEPLFAKIRPEQVETAEGQIIAVASEAVKAGQDYDMDNYLMTLIEHRRRALYLLHQRSR